MVSSDKKREGVTASSFLIKATGGQLPYRLESKVCPRSYTNVVFVEGHPEV